MIVPVVTASGCLFRGVWGFCVSVRVPLQLFLSCCFQSGICQSSSTGTLLLIGRWDQCSSGFIWVFCVLSLYVFIISCVCVTHDVCIVLGLSLVFLVFLLCVDRKKRFIIFILSQHLLLDNFHMHWHFRCLGTPQLLLESRQCIDKATDKASSLPKSSTQREPSAFEAVKGTSHKPPTCSSCHAIGHKMNSKACPQCYSEVL